MITPTRRKENNLKKQGYKLIAGIDEAGRGALAGPLVAVCVILPNEFDEEGIRDSKLLSPKQREKLFLQITKNALQWSVGIVDNTLIDKIGIQEANSQAFKLSVQKLKITPDYLLIDGREITHHPIPYEYVVDGDANELSIAAASIIAKVTRDHIMQTLHNELPHYAFGSHKGYGTLEHLQALKTHGPSRVHRRTFKPIKINKPIIH